MSLSNLSYLKIIIKVLSTKVRNSTFVVSASIVAMIVIFGLNFHVIDIIV